MTLLKSEMIKNGRYEAEDKRQKEEKDVPHVALVWTCEGKLERGQPPHFTTLTLTISFPQKASPHPFPLHSSA